MPSKYYPFALFSIIFASIYFMYGDLFSPQQVDLGKYRELCLKYQSAPRGTYPGEEIHMLVNEVNYLLPKKMNEITDANERELKACAKELAARISKDNV